jgi:hypothetical protein
MLSAEKDVIVIGAPGSRGRHGLENWIGAARHIVTGSAINTVDFTLY